jgi:hypothetical protein
VAPVKSRVISPVVELPESKLPEIVVVVAVIFGSPLPDSVLVGACPVKLVIPVIWVSWAEADAGSANMAATARASSIILLHMIVAFLRGSRHRREVAIGKRLAETDRQSNTAEGAKSQPQATDRGALTLGLQTPLDERTTCANLRTPLAVCLLRPERNRKARDRARAQ